MWFYFALKKKFSKFSIPTTFTTEHQQIRFQLRNFIAQETPYRRNIEYNFAICLFSQRNIRTPNCVLGTHTRKSSNKFDLAVLETHVRHKKVNFFCSHLTVSLEFRSLNRTFELRS
jgi:hypothetical protein